MHKLSYFLFCLRCWGDPAKSDFAASLHRPRSNACKDIEPESQMNGDWTIYQSRCSLNFRYRLELLQRGCVRTDWGASCRDEGAAHSFQDWGFDDVVQVKFPPSIQHHI